jgi:CheY-like chemotaxis protein
MPLKKVLLAEDDFDDRTIFMEAFLEMDDESISIESVCDGIDVINYLKAIKNDDELPQLFILDQNMPKMTGKATLAYLKTNYRYSHIPVIIYSTYPDDRLVKEFTTLGAELVVSKPDSYEGFKEMAQRFIGMLISNESRTITPTQL